LLSAVLFVEDTVRVDVPAVAPLTVTLGGLREHPGAGASPLVMAHESDTLPV
jgi:hypothetical protein